jgi:hypothetical protein
MPGSHGGGVYRPYNPDNFFENRFFGFPFYNDVKPEQHAETKPVADTTHASEKTSTSSSGSATAMDTTGF